LLHPVGDSFLFAQILYLLEASSTTGFFFFLTVDQGLTQIHRQFFYGAFRGWIFYFFEKIFQPRA